MKKTTKCQKSSIFEHFRKRSFQKKAILFHPLMVFFTLVVLLYALYMIDAHKAKLAGPDGFIGKRQTDLLGVYQNTENTLFYVDQSAKLSAEKAVFYLAENGGHINNNRCSAISGYSIWQRGSEECYPVNIKLNFYSLLNEDINKYFTVYNSFNDFKIPLDNYIYTIYQNQLIGTALKNFETNIFSSDSVQAAIGRYSIKPSFNVPFYFDFRRYEIIIDQAKDLFDVCNKSDDIKSCVEEYMKKPEFAGWNVGYLDPLIYDQLFLDKTFLFNVSTGSKMLVYSNDKIEEKEAMIKFALYFS